MEYASTVAANLFFLGATCGSNKCRSSKNKPRFTVFVFSKTVETIVSAAATGVSAAETIVSAVEIVVLAAEKLVLVYIQLL